MSRRARATIASLAIAVMLGAASAQPAQPSAGPASISEAVMWLTRSGDRSFTGPTGSSVHMSADVTFAHPAFYAVGGQSVPDGVADGTDVVFFLTENVHDGDLPPEPTTFRLYVDGRRPLEAAEVHLVNADPHHRTHRLVFRGATRSDGTLERLVEPETSLLVLSAVGGNRPLVLSWHLQEDYEGPPLLNLAGADVIRIRATEAGFEPASVEVVVGRPVIVVFQNDSEREHHFHVIDLPIGDTMRWLTSVPGFDGGDDAYRAAAQFDDHICTGSICPTGAWVHLHADPGAHDAIAFVPQESGAFEVTCPLHPDMAARFVVRGEGTHPHHHH
jgi:plastocyanin